MVSAMPISVAFMLVIAMVEANQCSQDGECPSGDKPTNTVSLLQTNVLKVDGDAEAPAAVLSPRSDGTGDVPSSPRVALLVRTYAPSAETTRRITQWVSSLQASSDVDVFISIDEEDQHDVSSLLKALNTTGFNLSHIHRYDNSATTRAYPVMNIKLRKLMFSMHQSLAYRYVQPAVDLFLQTLPRTTKEYDYLWVFEDDVGYTGDISELLEKYSGHDDDLISDAFDYNCSNHSSHTEDQTLLYKDWVLPEQRVLSMPHVVRMSSRLLEKLHHWLEKGAIQYAEEMPPTVCKIENMKCSELAEIDKGEPYGFEPYDNITITSAAKWEALQSEDAKLGKPRLYHPLKM